MRDNFSAQAREVLSFASEEALRLGDRALDTEHLLLGLIRQGNNSALRVLHGAQVDLDKLWQEAEAVSLVNGHSRTKSDFRMPLSRQSRKVIDRAQREARSLQSPVVQAEHLVLSLLRHKKNKAARILEHFNLSYEAFLSGVLR